MKQCIFTFLGLCLAIISHAQLYGNEWIAGNNPLSFITADSNNVHIDSLPNYNLVFTVTIANICDENGNLLFISNGTGIFDKNGDTLQNGNGINPCEYTSEYTCCGLNIPQAALFIPQPGNNRYYYLFHFSNDVTESARPATIYYSLIDKEGNGGLGAVIIKNDTVFHTSQLREGGMTACKHANGRDYWLIMGASVNGAFYKFLITPDKILGPYTQSIGPQFPLPYDNAYSHFSQDGSKYVTGVYEGPVLVMDFDRCTGEFSNPITIFNQACNPPSSSCSGSCSVEFSPNNRFVYVSDVVNLNQYDLLSSNIQDSAVQIYLVDSNQYAQLHFLQLAPNGKIFLSSWAGILTYDSLHVINSPDLKGDSCNFLYASQPTYSHNNDIPNMINYSLGALAGSGCDTIVDTVAGIEPLVQNNMHVMPNPADKYIHAQMSSSGSYEFELLSTLGQIIEIQHSAYTVSFNTENFAAGIYYVKAINKSNKQQYIVKKVVVSH